MNRFRAWRTWICAVSVMLLLLTWLLSYRCRVLLHNRYEGIGLLPGRLDISWWGRDVPLGLRSTSPAHRSWSVYIGPLDPRWPAWTGLPCYSLTTAGGEIAYVWIPLWMLSLIFAIPLGFQLLRRRCHGLCHSCGYDVDTLATGARCPECGTVISKQMQPVCGASRGNPQ